MPAHLARSRRTAAPSVSLRPGRKRDLDRLLEIHTAAFPDPRPIEVRRRVFMANKLGGIEHLRVAERAGELIAHAFLFPLEVWVCGARVSAAGIASVGVAVEARREGVASTLLADLHRCAAAAGAAFTVLYPFRQSFYSGLGYVPAAHQRVLTTSPAAIPAEWALASPGRVRRMVGRDLRALARAYEAAARQGNGLIVRPDRLWESYLLDERRQWLVLEHHRRMLGYTSFTLQQAEPHARVRAVVHEVVAPTDAARRRLLAALRTLSSQVAELTLTLAADDPLDWSFLDADRDLEGTEAVEHAIGVVSTGPMLRSTSASRVAMARGYRVTGRLNVKVASEAAFEVDVRDGRATVARPRKGPTLVASARAFAAVALGGLGVHDAVRLGWLPGNDPGTLELAASLFQIPSFFTLDAF